MGLKKRVIPRIPIQKNIWKSVTLIDYNGIISRDNWPHRFNAALYAVLHTKFQRIYSIHFQALFVLILQAIFSGNVTFLL